MYRVPPAGRWWTAVGAPLERGARQRHACCNAAAGVLGRGNSCRPAADCNRSAVPVHERHVFKPPVRTGDDSVNAACGPTNELKLCSFHAVRAFELANWRNVIGAGSAVTSGDLQLQRR